MFLLPQLVESRQSKINGTIQVYKLWGKYSISVGNLTQSGGLVEQIWEKALKAVASYQLPVNSILILGLGVGTAAKIVRKYWPQAQITGVDIDPVMIEMGEKYLGLEGAKIVIADAAEWIRKTDQKFDGVFVDVYQGKKIPESVTNKEFLENLRKRGRWAIFNRLKMKEFRLKNETFKQKLIKIFGQYEIIKTPVNELLLV